MKCEFCNNKILEIPGKTFHYKNKAGNSFCCFDCLESFYLKKIEDLAKSEHAWHEEWFNSREIIAKHGVDLIRRRTEANKITAEQKNSNFIRTDCGLRTKE